MKKGLTYISERTGQLRYADNANNEKWLQQISEYKPIEEIRRGEAVSIATVDDLKDIAKRKYPAESDKEQELYTKLLQSSDSYIVKTNPKRHVSTVGLSLEYEAVENIDDIEHLKLIHILGRGKYIEDLDYITESEQHNHGENQDNLSKYEYWPDFFNDYENSIGQKIYVDGENPGQLTLIKEKAYLAECNVIIVGFVADANIKAGNNPLQLGAIEVQIEGDDRGAIDSTQIEAVLGEDVVIADALYDIHNQKVSMKTKVFALGCENDSYFKFNFNFYESKDTSVPAGFIAIQKLDGKTSFIFTNGNISFDDLNASTLSIEDKAFIQVAKSYKVISGEDFHSQFLGSHNVYTSDFKLTKANVKDLKNLLNESMKTVAGKEEKSLLDESTHHITGLNVNIVNHPKGFSLEGKANDIGGYYDIYISENLRGYFQELYIDGHGSSYNKGYAVVADIRNKNRQNILGIYHSGKTGIIERKTRAIFLKQGIFNDDRKPFDVGSTYYLGSHGNVFKAPQEFYNSIVKVGYAQSDSRLIVDLTDPRMYNNGDLPVGYMKPSVNGEAEFGFLLMDGKTYHKIEDFELLFIRLKNWYTETELKVDKTHDFGSGDISPGFIIPEVKYAKHLNDPTSNGYVAAQIKYLAEGVYKELPRIPFLRRTFDLTKKNNIVKIPDIDITSLVIYGPEEDKIYVPELENLNIKLFIDTQNIGQVDNPQWTQVEPGFKEFNNTSYYGFKWEVFQKEKPTLNSPFGEWILRARYNEGIEDENVLGVYLKSTPFSPPQSMEGHRAKIFVARNEYYTRQFDVENLFKDYVKESVVDITGKPWTRNAVSGKAVIESIKEGIKTQNLEIGKTDDFGTMLGYLKSIHIQSNKADEIDNILNIFTIDSIFKSPHENIKYDLVYHKGRLSYKWRGIGTESETDIYTFLKYDENKLSLLPYKIFKEHENLKCEEDHYPHNIHNKGFSGNINAKTLQSAQLGTPSSFLLQNIDENVANELQTGSTTGARVIIPYLKKFAGESKDYGVTLGKKISIEIADGVAYKTAMTSDVSRSSDTFINVTDYGPNILKSVYTYKGTPAGGQLKEISMLHIFGDDTDNADIKFEKTIGGATSPASVYGNFLSSSSLKYKKVFSEYISKNNPIGDLKTDFPESWDINIDTNTDTYGEALQALYELPLASFNYKNEDSLKRYFGIITERVALTKDNFDNEQSNATSFENDLEWTYTEKERKSIKEYLNVLTDNKDKAQNIMSSVGILLKAAKETQERLLNLEMSTYGKDSPTLPGTDKLNDNLKDNNQHKTIAGLNRLVKALCREVFQDADPSNIDIIGAWSNSDDKYSRVDLLDKQVFGEKAKDDNGTRIQLNDVDTYPDNNDVVQTLNIQNEKIKDSEHNDDFDNGPDFITNVIEENSYTKNPADKFDGINDAINRIVLKLNRLTSHINGEDNIKNRPKVLDNIRQTLETLLKDVFYDTTIEAENLISSSFKKTKLSRIDKLIQTLYNFDLEAFIDETHGNEPVFNTRQFNGTVENTTEKTIYKSISPETIDDIYSKASIIDVIADLLAGGEKDLLRHSTYAFNDKDNDITTNYKDEHYDATNSIKNNVHYFDSKTVLERLGAIEKALELLSLRVSNKLKFEDLVMNQGKSQYENISSIDDFFNKISATLGLEFNKDKVNPLDTSLSNEQNLKDRTNLYNVLSGVLNRIRINERNLLTNNDMLGSEYSKDKRTEPLSLDDTLSSIDNSNYSITSDVSALLNLLYGKDIVPGVGEKSFNHFTDDNINEYAKHNGGVSVLDVLYNKLYNTPQKKDNINYASDVRKLDEIDNFNSIVYDFAEPRKTVAISDFDNPILHSTNRNKFIKQSDFTLSPKNRIDILEDGIKSLYTYIGLGNNNVPGYYSGIITYGNNGIINGKIYGTLAQKWSDAEVNYTLSDTGLQLSHIATQAYLNTLFIKKSGIGNLNYTLGSLKYFGIKDDYNIENSDIDTTLNGDGDSTVTQKLKDLATYIARIPRIGCNIGSENKSIQVTKTNHNIYKVSNSDVITGPNIISRDQEVIDLNKLFETIKVSLYDAEYNAQQYAILCQELSCGDVDVVKYNNRFFVRKYLINATGDDIFKYYEIKNSIFILGQVYEVEQNKKYIQLTLIDKIWSMIKLSAYIRYEELQDGTTIPDTDVIDESLYIPTKYLQMMNVMATITGSSDNIMNTLRNKLSATYTNDVVEDLISQFTAIIVGYANGI